MDDYTTQSNLLQIHYNYFAYGYPFKCQLHKMVKDTTNCFSVFNHFVGLAIKGLIKSNNGINQFRCIQGNFLNLKDRLGWKHQKSLSKEQNTGKKTKFQKNPGNVTENEQQWKKFGFAHSKNAFHTKKDYYIISNTQPSSRMHILVSSFRISFSRCLVYFSNGIYSIQEWAVTTWHGVTRKQDGEGERDIE